jgi:hypothetical protein
MAPLLTYLQETNAIIYNTTTHILAYIFSLLFTTADLIDKTQLNHKIHSVVLPINEYMAATAIKNMRNYCDGFCL